MKFGYTILYVADVQKTVEFYERAFGLERKFIHEGGYGELDTGATKLAFYSHALASSHRFSFVAANPAQAPLGMEVALVTEDIQEAFDRAVAAGAVAIQAPEPKPWGQTVGYVRDMNGFLVELCTPMG